MTEHDIAGAAVERLQSHAPLGIFLSDVPQAVVMPFAKNHTRKYLTVVLFVIEQAVNFETLAFICSTVVRLMRDFEGAELAGIEVMPCVVRDGSTQRVLRLSILPEALEKASGLSPVDLREAIPFVGATCQLYLKDIAT